MWYIYVYTHTKWTTTQAIKKSSIMPSAATWTDLEMIMLNEVSQKVKDKCHMI